MIPQSNFWMICRNNNPQLTPPTNKICKALPLNRRGFFTFWGDTWGLSYAPHGHTQAPYSATLLNMLGLPPNQPIELVRALYDTRRNGFRCGISRGRWMLPTGCCRPDVAGGCCRPDVAAYRGRYLCMRAASPAAHNMRQASGPAGSAADHVRNPTANPHGFYLYSYKPRVSLQGPHIQ